MKKEWVKVTYPLPKSELKKTEEFLLSKGHEIKYVKAKSTKLSRKNRTELFYIMRTVTDQERLDLASGKWKLKHGSFERVDTKKEKRFWTDCICPKCGTEHSMFNTEKYMYCAACRRELLGM